MAITSNKFLNFLEGCLPTKTFVITTKNKTKFIKITSLMQLCLITFFLSFAMFCSIKYRIYTNNNDISLLIEENEILKRENQQFENYYTTISTQIDAVNNYLGNNTEGENNVKKPTDISKVKELLNKKIALSFNSLNVRSKEIKEIIDKLGLERLTYNRIGKVVKMDSHNNELLAINNDNLSNVGGKYEPVVKISTNDLSPIISLPSTNINADNFDKEIKKMIKAEKFIAILPIGKPMKSNYKITSKFGVRHDPFEKNIAAHRGLDIVIEDKQIYAPADGIVVAAGKNTGYGNMIAIEHNLNKKDLEHISILTRYGHLEKMLVSKGDIVKKGQLIGIEGTTGKSTGCHLHFETIINKQHINPIYFIKEDKATSV